MLINPEEINKILNLADDIIITRGKKYYEQNKVDISSVDITDDNNYIITTKVQGTRLYRVNINKKNGKISYTCNCPYCDGYEFVCKHIIATLFDIYTENDKYLSSKKNNLDIETFELTKAARELLQKIYGSSYIEEKSGKKRADKNYSNICGIYEKKKLTFKTDYINKVELIPVFQKKVYEPYLEIKFLIGRNKKYVIKNLDTFASNVKYNNVERYGKELEFNHDLEDFSESAKVFLSVICNNNRMLTYDNKHLKVNGKILDDLFYLLKDKEYEIEELYSYDKEKIYFKDGNPKIDITVEQDKDKDLIVYIDENIGIIESIFNVYILTENTVYRCTKDFIKDALPLIKEISNRRDKRIIISKSNAASFINYTLPYFEKYSVIKCDEKIKDENKIEKLGVKAFLDLDEHKNIVCDVKYCYNDKEFNPFSLAEINKNTYNRNVIEETNAENLFNLSGFEVDKDSERLILKDEEKIYNFLTSGINEFMQKFEVLVTDRIKKRKIIAPQTTSIGVRMQNDLIELDFGKIDFDLEQIKEILKMYNVKRKFFRLKNGDFIDLESESISTLAELSENLEINPDELKNGKIYIPKYRAIHVNKLLSDNKKINYSRDDAFKNIINDIDNIRDLKFELPSGLNATLRNYQEIGYNWLKTLEKYNFGGILADDMGLGKTLQVIALLQNAKNDKEKTSIVVCPSSLYLNWQKEISKFAPDLKTLTIYGNANERKGYIKNIKKYDVIITSYDLLKRDIEEYTSIKFKYIIADEAQYIKNNNTQNAKALKLLNGQNRYALTGTPIENSLAELWSIFDFIMPGYLFTYNKFKTKYEKPIVIDKDEKMSKSLNQMISPFILRRIKKDVLDDLPDKTETILYNKMDEEQEKVYKAYLLSAKRELQDEILNVGFDKSQIKILALITRLRQICCHPKLFLENYGGQSSKLEQCIEVLKDSISAGHKILIFSGFTSMFELIEQELIKNNINYYKLTGQTKVNTRIELVEKFNNSDDVKVFLVSLKAGGTGLNLIGADVVMHFDPWWNLSLENQATDRTYRIGQKKNVQVFKFITEDSIEEKIQKIQENKKDLIDKVIKKGENFITKLKKEEILKLFEE